LDNKKLKDMVEEVWYSLNTRGWMSFVLQEKLKGVKGRLRE